MSYTVLARRYRSSTFDDLIGQDHVARTLKKAIESGRIAHAYLFCGTRGTGKTSTARILAKCLNCESTGAPTATPCGKCESCQAIARGEDMDVIEIDAASNTGVDNVRDVISNAQYRPARSRFKVYIIDETHMLSKAAFNALLKTLEEPPEHVKFILATTEPEKVLPTILSRCQRYDFRNIPTREIAAHLKDVAKKERIKADDDALLLVAKAGAGSMRDALSLLDRLLSVGEKTLTADMIEQMLGLPKAQLLFDLAQAIGEGDVKTTLGRAESIVSGGLSVDSLLAALVDHLRNLLVLRTCGLDTELVEVPGLPTEELLKQAEQFDPVALTQDITILEELRRNIRQSQAGRALLDATLVRMALSEQFASIGQLLSRLDGGGGKGAPLAASRPPGSGMAPKLPVQSPAQSPAQKKKPDEIAAAPAAAAAPAPTPAVAAAPVAIPSDPIAAADDEDDDDGLPAVGRVWEGPAPSLGAILKKHAAGGLASSSPLKMPADAKPQAAGAGASNVEPVSPHDLPGVWKALLALLAEHGPGLHSLLSHGRLVALDDGRAVIRYGAQHETLVKMLDRNGKKELVRDAITRVLKQSIGVKFEVEQADAAAVDAETSGAEEPAAHPAPDNLSVSRRPAEAGRPAVAPQPPAPPQPPAVKLTPELIESIRDSEPLVKALMDELGAQIIKVE
jgi:DNA polymerase-3 subunit gamma/tau